MAITYASKAEKKIAERFKLTSLTEAAVNRDYNWVGVNAINVYSLPTTALSDYTKTGSSRYGTTAEQQNTVQTMTIAKDRSYSISIDRATMQDTPVDAIAAKVAKQQTDEVVIPEIDTYRIATMATAAVSAGGTATAAVTASNAYQKFLAGTEYLGNNKVPVNGRIAFVSYAFYSFIKQDSSFMLASEVAMEQRVNGMVGMVDGVKIVPVPSSYLPANTAFVMCHPSATVAADKLTDLTLHDNPIGYSGVVVEGRHRYDAFVLTAKNTGVYTHKVA